MGWFSPKKDCCGRVDQLEAELGELRRLLRNAELLLERSELERESFRLGRQSLELSLGNARDKIRLWSERYQAQTRFADLYRDQLAIALERLATYPAELPTFQKIRDMGIKRPPT